MARLLKSVLDEALGQQDDPKKKPDPRSFEGGGGGGRNQRLQDSYSASETGYGNFERQKDGKGAQTNTMKYTGGGNPEIKEYMKLTDKQGFGDKLTDEQTQRRESLRGSIDTGLKNFANSRKYEKGQRFQLPEGNEFLNKYQPVANGPDYDNFVKTIQSKGENITPDDFKKSRLNTWIQRTMSDPSVDVGEGSYPQGVAGNISEALENNPKAMEVLKSMSQTTEGAYRQAGQPTGSPVNYESPKVKAVIDRDASFEGDKMRKHANWQGGLSWKGAPTEQELNDPKAIQEREMNDTRRNSTLMNMLNRTTEEWSDPKSARIDKTTYGKANSIAQDAIAGYRKGKK